MMKKLASFVLAALRGSTNGKKYASSSLAAVSLDGLFDHPARSSMIIRGLLQCGHSRVLEGLF
ncbi:MAG: hypothetical protein AB7G48_16680, partial [Nitrospiraceae bacterium]